MDKYQIAGACVERPESAVEAAISRGRAARNALSDALVNLSNRMDFALTPDYKDAAMPATSTVPMPPHPPTSPLEEALIDGAEHTERMTAQIHRLIGRITL